MKCDTVFMVLVLALCFAWVTASLPQLLELHVSVLYTVFAINTYLSDIVMQAVQYLQHNFCHNFSDFRDTTVTVI